MYLAKLDNSGTLGALGVPTGVFILGAVVVNDELYVYGVEGDTDDTDSNVTDDDDHKSYLAKLADNSLEPIGDGVPNVELSGAVVVNDELYVYGVEGLAAFNDTDSDDDDIKSYLAKVR